MPTACKLTRFILSHKFNIRDIHQISQKKNQFLKLTDATANYATFFINLVLRAYRNIKFTEHPKIYAEWC